MTIEESDNPGGTFQFKSDTAISIQVIFKQECIIRVAKGQAMIRKRMCSSRSRKSWGIIF